MSNQSRRIETLARSLGRWREPRDVCPQCAGEPPTFRCALCGGSRSLAAPIAAEYRRRVALGQDRVWTDEDGQQLMDILIEAGVLSFGASVDNFAQYVQDLSPANGRGGLRNPTNDRGES